MSIVKYALEYLFNKNLFKTGVEVINKKVYIYKFPVYQFKKDLKAKWGTTKIYHLYEFFFTRFSGNDYIRFHEFFLPEMIYILDNLPKRQLYRKTKELLYENTWISNIEKDFPNRINYSKLQELTKNLLPHQYSFLKEYDQKKQKYRLHGYLNAFATGFGKTITAIALMHCLEKDKIIVVAPNNTIYSTWVNEIKSSFKLEQTIWTKENPISNAKWYIINYESMNKVIELASKREFRGKNVGIIIDEIHHFRNKSTDRSQNALKLKELTNCTDILPMSGTPIKALVTEMIVFLKLLDPLFTDKVETIFRKTFNSSSSQLADIAANRIGSIMYRLEKDNSVIPLPEKTETTLKVKLPHGDKYTLPAMEKIINRFVEERESYYNANMHVYIKDYHEGLDYFEKHVKYNKIEYQDYKNKVKAIRNIYNKVELSSSKNTFTTAEISEIIKIVNIYEKKVIIPTLPNELKKRFRKAKSVYKYVCLTILGEVLGGILPKYRAELYKEMVEYGPIVDLVESAIKKSIIFTTYGAVVESSEAVFKKHGYKPLLIYQKTSKNREKNIESFKKDPDANPLVTTIQMMSTGVTLNEANVVIFAPPAFRHVDNEQASARCHRIGQTDPVFVYTLLLDTGDIPNLSTRIDDISNWSKDLFNRIVGVNVNTVDMDDVVENELATENLHISEEEYNHYTSAFEVL